MRQAVKSLVDAKADVAWWYAVDDVVFDGDLHDILVVDHVSLVDVVAHEVFVVDLVVFLIKTATTNCFFSTRLADAGSGLS